MTVCYSAAMLLGMSWISSSGADDRFSSSAHAAKRGAGEARSPGQTTKSDRLPHAAALFALAVLAKGLGPVVLAAPLLLGGRRITDWLKPRVLAPFFLVAVPWYALCYARNGEAFVHDFFVVHTFGRLASKALAHGQPFWYYLPVLLGAFLPWTPVLVLLARRKGYSDPRRQFLLAWFLFTLLFFSVMLNKLPGYILPAIPAAAALAGIALDEVPRARMLLTVCALLSVVFPIAAAVLPDAFFSGLSHATRPAFQPLWLAPIAVAALAWTLETRGRRLAAALAVSSGVALGMGYLKIVDGPILDQRVSARATWREVATHSDDVCVGALRRDWIYGLNYYAGRALPSCDEDPKPLQILSFGDRLIVVPDRP
jgi:4-amino-4-deoxy-L-arabinose transferase-like glycosyltransferase